MFFPNSCANERSTFKTFESEALSIKTKNGWNLRSNAGSFSICFNSVKVVTPVHWSSALARAGFKIFSASNKPSAVPAPTCTIVWTSSQWKMTCLSQSLKYRTLEFFYSIIFKTETEGVFGPKVMCQSIHSLNQTWHCKHAARGECAVAMGCSISQTLMSYVLKNSEQNGQVWTKWKETWRYGSLLHDNI